MRPTPMPEARLWMTWTRSGIGGLRGCEIGRDDVRMGLDFLRRAFGDLAAEIEHDDALRDLHHQAHVVLDQQYGDAAVADTQDSVGERLRFLRVEAGRGLVEQQEPRPRRQCARDFQQTLLSVGQSVGLAARLRAEAYECQQFTRLLADARFLLAHPARAEECGADRTLGR